GDPDHKLSDDWKTLCEARANSCCKPLNDDCLQKIQDLEVFPLNSANCAADGSSDAQLATDTVTIKGYPGCFYRMCLTVAGKVENQNNGYDIVSVNEDAFFSSDGEHKACTMNSKSVTRRITTRLDANGRGQLTLRYNTGDEQFHLFDGY